MRVIVLGGTGQVGRGAVKVSVMRKEYSMGEFCLTTSEVRYRQLTT